MSERGAFRGGSGGNARGFRGGRGGGGASDGHSRGGGGGRGGGRGGGYHGGRGGGGGAGGGGGSAEKPKKENILDLTKYMDKEIRVKFSGGREGMFSSLRVDTISLCHHLSIDQHVWMCCPSFEDVASSMVYVGGSSNGGMAKTAVGILKGYDQLMNLVLDDVKEIMRGMCSLLFFYFCVPASTCTTRLYQLPSQSTPLRFSKS